MQVQLSSIGIINPNDTVISVNGMQMPQQTSASSLPVLMPQTFFWENNSFGEMRLCCARIDGTPMTIIANDGASNYTAVVENYSILFPFGLKTHPEHRPK